MDDEAMKAMARQIVDNLDFTSMRPVTSYDAAYAAIIETQERCAALVERTHMGDLQFPPQSIPRAETAAAIRSGQQFRKDV